MKRNSELWCCQKQATHALQLMSALASCLFLLSPFSSVPNRSYANISSRRLSHRNSVGSGNAPMEKIASIDMHYHLDLSSKPRRKQQTRQLKRMLSVWKSFWKSRFAISVLLSPEFTDGLAQRHKLGSKLTPVTPETFAVWKKTRMDKKEAEQEASRKTKELQSSAGKSSGMSGRDLVRLLAFFCFQPFYSLRDFCSSNTTQNGSKMKRMEMHLMTGISRNTDANRKKII